MACSCFPGRGFAQGQNESTVAQQEADCRGGGSPLDVDMELNSLGWALWRRAQALRKKARKSVLAPQNTNMFTKTGPTNNHYESRVSYCPLFSRPLCPLLILPFSSCLQDCPYSQAFPSQGGRKKGLWTWRLANSSSTTSPFPSVCRNL